MSQGCANLYGKDVRQIRGNNAPDRAAAGRAGQGSTRPDATTGRRLTCCSRLTLALDNRGLMALGPVISFIGFGSSLLGGFGPIIGILGIEIWTIAAMASCSQANSADDKANRLMRAVGWGVAGVPLGVVLLTCKLCRVCVPPVKQGDSFVDYTDAGVNFEWLAQPGDQYPNRLSNLDDTPPQSPRSKVPDEHEETGKTGDGDDESDESGDEEVITGSAPKRTGQVPVDQTEEGDTGIVRKAMTSSDEDPASHSAVAQPDSSKPPASPEHQFGEQSPAGNGGDTEPPQLDGDMP